MHQRIFEIKIGLVGVETVPKIGLRDGVPIPVRRLEIFEDDPRLAIFVRGIAPDVKIAPRAAGPGAARTLEPGVLVGGVVNHQLGDYPQAAPVGFA